MRFFRRMRQWTETAATWTAKNPILLDGELGVESNTGLVKVGNGVDHWVDLPYSNQVGEVVADASKLTGKAPLSVIPVLSSAKIPPLPYVAQDSQAYNVLDHGAVGDGVTNDGPAINALIDSVSAAGGGVVLVPPTANGYACTGITLKSGVELRGAAPGARLVKTVQNSKWITFGTAVQNVAVTGLLLDDAGLVTSYMLEVGVNSENVRIEGCTFTGSSIGVETRDGARRVLVRGCKFEQLNIGVRVNRDPDGVTVEGCTFEEWADRAIQVLGSTVAASNLWVRDNIIRPHRNTGTGAVRQPVQFSASDDNVPFTNVHVTGNTVLGLGTDYEDTTIPGSADLISLHRCDGFEVSGNVVVDGGDVGITIAQQCRNGTVTGNVAMRNDSAGICIGSTQSTYTDNIVVSGNLCMNNGQDRVSGGTPSSARTGVRLNNAHNIVVGDNTLGDNQTTKTQQSGLSLGNCDNVRCGENVDAGNAVGLFDTSGGGNTNCTKPAAPVAL